MATSKTPEQTTNASSPPPPDTVTLTDGRTLAYAHYGTPLSQSTKPPIFYFNGTPSSRLEAQLVHSAAQKQSLSIISTDRPSFGHSTPQPTRTLLQWPSDILALADHLQITKFGVIGLSGGGPYVLACLHSIPRDRLVAASIISGIYPIQLGTGGMMWQTRLMFWTARYSTWLVEKMLEMSMGSLIRNSSDAEIVEKMTAQAASLPQPPADKEVREEIMNDKVLFNAFIGSMREALRTDSRGAAQEMSLFAGDWGFKVEELDVEGGRLGIWHGSADVNCPVGMPDQVAKMLPGVQYRRLEGEGHVSVVVRHRESILEELGGRLGGVGG